MFAKHKVTQSMIDAVNSVISEGLADDMLSMAKKVNPNAKARTGAQPKKEPVKVEPQQKTTSTGKTGLALNHGYGQGRYMGDSVEINGSALEEDQRFINAVSKVINGEKNVSIEEERTEEKDKNGKVVRWKDETDWYKSKNKDGRGKATNLSDKARKETEKLAKEEVTKKKPDWLIAAEKRAEAKQGKLPESVESLDEKNWIKGAIKHPGALTAAAKKAGESNSEYEQQHKHDSGVSGKRSRLALTLKKMHHEAVEALDEKSTSEKQARTMAAAAHNPAFAKKVGIPQSVAKDFNQADKGTKQLSNAMKKEEVEQMDEGGMPSSVIKNKQRNANMSDKDFANAHKDKSDDELRSMAWRHGYGKDSSHYVDRRSRGQQGVQEEVESVDEADNAFNWKNKPSEIGRHLTSKHTARKLSDTSTMYTKKYGKDLEHAKDALTAHNASVYAKSKMKKEENENEGLSQEDSGWMKKTKKMTKEDTGLDTPPQKKEKTTDTLAGRVKVPKNFQNQHISTKVELESESTEHPDEAEDKKLIARMIKQDDKIEDAKDTKKDIKLIKKYMHKEAIEHLSGNECKVHSGPHAGVEGKIHAIHGKVFEIQPKHAKSVDDHVYVPQHHVVSTRTVDEAFHGPEAGSGVGDTPFVSNDSKPVKLAKYLATKTADKMKNEMLGKMTN
jgi:hypothetical protein